MPPVIAAGILSVAPLTGATAVTVAGISLGTVATLGSYAVFAGGLFAAQMLLAPDLSAPRSKRASAAEDTSDDSIGPRQRGYGKAKIGGSRIFRENKDGARYSVVVHCQGKIDGIERYYFNGRNADVNGSGQVGDPFPANDKVTVESFVGTSGQLVSSLLQAAFEQWTNQHQLLGIAYTVVEYKTVLDKKFTEWYPQGEPEMAVLARLAQVYDPRVLGSGSTQEVTNPDEWTWSSNASLCLLDWYTQPDGRGKDYSRMDEASFVKFADICDRTVNLKLGGNEPLYRIWGLYDLTEEPRNVEQRMLAACDGEIYQNSRGKIAIRGGEWENPSVTFTDDSILSFELERGNGRMAAFNQTKIIYVSADHDFQETEGEPWEDLDSQADIGLLATDLTLDMVPSHGQARRLAKIHHAKGNPKWKGRIVTNVLGLDAIGERIVQVQISELGIDDSFLITSIQIAGDFSKVEMGIVALDASAYAWDPQTEEGTAPPLPEDTRQDVVIPDPLGLILTQVDRASGTLVMAEVDNPAGRDDYVLEGRIREVTPDTGPWKNMDPDADDPYVVRSNNNLDIGTEYGVNVRFSGAHGRSSAWVSANITLI